MLPKYGDGNTMSSRVSVVGVGLRRSSSRKVIHCLFHYLQFFIYYLKNEKQILFSTKLDFGIGFRPSKNKG
jgi:hypothetical protein